MSKPQHIIQPCPACLGTKRLIDAPCARIRPCDRCQGTGKAHPPGLKGYRPTPETLASFERVTAALARLGDSNREWTNFHAAA